MVQTINLLGILQIIEWYLKNNLDNYIQMIKKLLNRIIEQVD